MTDPSTSKYTYSPLLPGHRSIRLLRLHPSSVSDAPIQCQLFNYSLTFPRRSFHLYECLSYVWGSSENKQHILIDGKLFNITQNLHAALIRLRDAYIDRIMWVDAICMNQDDVKERTHQVKSMAMIYAYASRVVVWLGEEADESSATMEKIRIEANTRIRQRSWDRISVPVRPDHQKTEECTIENALLSFLRRPWFRRVWVSDSGSWSISFSDFPVGIARSSCSTLLIDCMWTERNFWHMLLFRLGTYHERRQT